MSFLENCMAIWANPYREVARWKNELGCRVVGWGMMYAPEELISAAGCLPVYLHGQHTLVTEGNRLLQSYFCPPLRLMSNSILKGDPGVVDMMLFVSNCDEAEHIANLLSTASLPVHSMHIPFALHQKICQEKVRTEIRNARHALETLSGRRISKDALRESIAVHNRTRALLRELYALRMKFPGFLTCEEMRAIVGASLFMPKSIYNEKLSAYLGEVKDRLPSTAAAVKVILAGSICDDPGDDVLSALKDSGLSVVNDDLYIGGHYIRYDLDETCDPFEAISKIYWEGVPTPCKRQKEQRNYAEELVALAQKSGAQGIINFEWKFCEFQSYARPYLREVFDRADIPCLKIDLAEESMAQETIRNRYETFAEMLERRAPR